MSPLLRSGIAALLCLACLRVSANFDTRPADVYTIANGLSQNSIWAMASDPQGFLWIGTEDGLNRFDGQQFRVFRRDEQDPFALADNFVTALAGAERAMYIGTRAGRVQRLDLGSEQFLTLPSTIEASIRGNAIETLVVLSSGELLIGTRDHGLHALNWRDPQNPRLLRSWRLANATLPNDAVRTINETQNGDVWIGTERGLCRIHRLGEYCERPNWPVVRELDELVISAVREDSRGQVWIATAAKGLYRVRANGKVSTHFALDTTGEPGAHRIEELHLDRQEQLWIGTDRSVFRFDPACECLVEPRAQGRISPGGARLTTAIHEDRDAGLWIGYWGLGLERIAMESNGIRHYLPSVFDASAEPANRVRAILPDGQDHYWLGALGGGVWSMRIDATTGLIASLSPLTAFAERRVVDQQIWALSRVDQALWAGTDGGLFRVSLTEQSIQQVLLPILGSSPGRQAIRRLLRDGPWVWVGHEGGLCRIAIADLATTCLGAGEQPTQLSNPYVYALLRDRQGRFWAGTWSGLHEIDTTSMQARRIVDSEIGIPGALIWDIHESAGGQLWLGTSDGLVQFTPGRPAQVFREREGLANRVVYGIEEDDDGFLWLSSNRGVMRFDPRTLAVTGYDQRDGLQGNEFVFGAHAKDDSGRILFGGIDGLNRIEAKRVPRTLKPPRVLLTQISVLGQELSPTRNVPDMPRLARAANYTEAIELGPAHNMIGLEFSAVDFDQPRLLNFEYQLAGFDDRWISLGKRRFLSFTNLAPGDYRLQIRARNRFGEVSLTPAQLAIRVVPPYYATWWFRLLAMALLVLALWAVFLWRTRDLRMQRQRLEREVAHRTEEVRAQNLQLATQRQALEQANQELYALSNRDPLTGAFNRRYIQERMARIVAEGREFAIALLDIDHFKRINDQFGHQAGDDCLRFVVAKLVESLPPPVEFARWGGEEFLILLPEQTRAEVASTLERLRERLSERPAVAAAAMIQLTASIGWTRSDQASGLASGELIKRADAALYRAKEQGRNRVLCADQ